MVCMVSISYFKQIKICTKLTMQFEDFLNYIYKLKHFKIMEHSFFPNFQKKAKLISSKTPTKNPVATETKLLEPKFYHFTPIFLNTWSMVLTEKLIQRKMNRNGERNNKLCRFLKIKCT